jgi:CRP-like cAMP-binding protein
LFGGLDDKALDVIAGSVGQRSYRRGEAIFHEGDSGDWLFVVASGHLKLEVSSSDGDTMLVTTLGAGDTFGELALIDQGPRSGTVVALEPATLLTVARPTVIALLTDRPGLADPLLRSVGTTVRRLTRHAADLALLDLPTRVAKLLLMLAEQQQAGTADGATPTVEVRLTQTDMANMVGGSRQSVNQILSSFAARGLIEQRGRTIVLRGLEQLRRRAGV